MTTQIDTLELSDQIRAQFPGSVESSSSQFIIISSDYLEEVARYCHDSPSLTLDLLVSITGIDYLDYLEVVYHLVSIKHNHSVFLKTRSYSREHPQVPSVTGIWQGADFQEREVYDLMGISFEGHPNLKRVLLWEGFNGHPQRKDFTSA